MEASYGVCTVCQKKYFVCRVCGRVEPIDNMYDDDICKSCYAEEYYIKPYHSNYPDLRFYSLDNDEELYLGVELEVDDGGEIGKNAMAACDYVNSLEKTGKNFLYCSHDGSLDDGFEVITQPATFNFHVSLYSNYANMMRYLSKHGYKSHDTRTCGIHVHFNRSFYRKNDELYTSRLLYLVDKFWNQIVIFSRRNVYSMDRYALKKDQKAKEFYKEKNQSGLHDDHYYSLNISNFDTIEFRMFKGTLNVNTILATLQLVNNIVIVAKNKKMAEIKNMKWEDFLTTKYQKMYWERHKIVPDGEE